MTYNTPGFLIIGYVNLFVQGFQVVVLPPLFGSRKLLESILRHKFPGSQIPAIDSLGLDSVAISDNIHECPVVVTCFPICACRRVVAFLCRQSFEAVKS